MLQLQRKAFYAWPHYDLCALQDTRRVAERGYGSFLDDPTAAVSAVVIVCVVIQRDSRVVVMRR